MNLFLHPSRLLLPPDQSDLHGEQPHPRDRQETLAKDPGSPNCVPWPRGSPALLGDPPIPEGGALSLLTAGLVISPMALGPIFLKFL